MDSLTTLLLMVGGFSLGLFTLGVIELVLVKLGYFREDDDK